MPAAQLPRILLAALTLIIVRQEFALAELPTATFNGLSRANGKQVVRLGHEWLVIRPEPSGERAWLSTAKYDAPLAEAEWDKTLFLSSDDKGLFRSNGACATPPSLAVDHVGRVHAAWGSGDGVWYAQSTAKNASNLFQRSAWSGAEGQPPAQILADVTLGDLAVDERCQVWISAVRQNKDGQTTLCLLHYTNEWETTELATDVGFLTPVMHVSGGGTVHLAWADTRGRLLYLEHRPGEKHELQVLCKGGYGPNARNPSIIATGKQVLIAYETMYDQIEYAVREDGAWRSTWARLTAGDDRLKSDVLHSPQLALDRHGVVWLYLSDTMRRYTYFMRWLGSEWSDACDCRGIYYRSPRFESDLLPADWLAVEKYPPANAAEMGISLANSLVPAENEFHRIAVPAPQGKAGTTVLFLDLLETAGMQNLELVLDEAKKDPRNPLVKPGPAGSFDQDRVLNHGTVLFDADKFRMWYGAAHRQRGVYWWRWMSTGYAQSNDGIVWDKPCVEASSATEKLDCNQLPLPWPCSVFKDVEEKNPEHRYKVVQFDRHQLQLIAAQEGKYDMDSPTCPGGLYQSADGLHWKFEPISISFPDGKPRELVVQSFFIDPQEPDPARRWKVYGYASLVTKRRAGCFAYSADGKKWIAYPRNPILDPTVSEVPLVPSGPESQIHDTVVFPYRGYYLSLFHAQHDARFLDVELAVSRDGEHFTHVKRGHKVIPLGTRGAWDWQQILQTPVITAHDKLWLFYGGQTMPADLLAKGETNNELLVGGAGLATLRLDGFTHLALRAGQKSGSITTVPIEISKGQPLSLVVNAACNSDATITVEVLDAESGKPIAGFDRGNCQPLASDGLRSVVQWKQGESLPSGHGKVALRFWLEGSAAAVGPQLYGFSLVAADKFPVNGS